jgi:DNA repair protein RadC
MIMLKTFERTPSLAELKVSYKRGRGKDDRQEKLPWLISTPTTCEAYLRSVWDGATLELREEFLRVCLDGADEVLGWVEIATGGIDATLVDPRLVFAAPSGWRAPRLPWRTTTPRGT